MIPPLWKIQKELLPQLLFLTSRDCRRTSYQIMHSDHQLGWIPTQFLGHQFLHVTLLHIPPTNPLNQLSQPPSYNLVLFHSESALKILLCGALSQTCLSFLCYNFQHIHNSRYQVSDSGKRYKSHGLELVSNSQFPETEFLRSSLQSGMLLLPITHAEMLI